MVMRHLPISGRVRSGDHGKDYCLPVRQVKNKASGKGSLRPGGPTHGTGDFAPHKNGATSSRVYVFDGHCAGAR